PGQVADPEHGREAEGEAPEVGFERGGACGHHDEQGDVGGDQGAHSAQGCVGLGDGVEGFGYVGPDARGDDPAQDIHSGEHAEREHEYEQTDPDREPVFADAFGGWVHELPLRLMPRPDLSWPRRGRTKARNYRLAAETGTNQRLVSYNQF